MNNTQKRHTYKQAHSYTHTEVLKRTYVNYLLQFTMSQKDSWRQPITSSSRRWYFSPTAKVGQPWTSLASPGVEHHPSLHRHSDRHSLTEAHIGTHDDTYTQKNSSLPVTRGEMGQRALWWMAFMQVMCGVKRETAPHQENAAVQGSRWSIDARSLLPQPPVTPQDLPTMLTSSISHS